MSFRLLPWQERIVDLVARYPRVFLMVARAGGRQALQRALELEEADLRLRALGGFDPAAGRDQQAYVVHTMAGDTFSFDGERIGEPFLEGGAIPRPAPLIDSAMAMWLGYNGVSYDLDNVFVDDDTWDGETDEGPGLSIDELLGKIDGVLADQPSNRGSAG